MGAEQAFQEVMSTENKQGTIITGELGARKTESCKIILIYIAHASSKNLDCSPNDFYEDQTSSEGIGKYILDSNPLLEAFDNSKTFTLQGL